MILAYSALGLALGSEVRMAQGLGWRQKDLGLCRLSPPLLAHSYFPVFLFLSSSFSPASSVQGQAVLSSRRPYCSFWVG